MREMTVPAQYLQIAADVASRVAAGDLPEGERLFGRSVMASEYGVSPETIRRALRMLADMKVIDVKPQSGAVVLCDGADSAQVRLSVIRAVSAFTGLGSDEIVIAKLK